jgi:hypothetical protein
MSKKFTTDFSSNGAAVAGDKLLIQKASDSTVNYILVSDLLAVMGLTLPGATTAPGAGFDTAGGVKSIPFGKRGTSGLFVEEIYVDLKTAAVSSSTTDLDIIGEAAGGAAYIGQITAAKNGTVVALTVTCLEVPATGVADIDLYSATENSGVFDGGIAALIETALITAGGSWTIGLTKVATALPAADQYLYLTGGAAGTPGAYSAGKFLIKIYGV